jgi:hypothetical protein
MEKISPKDYFKKLAFSIKDAEIRLVAAIMSDYVGEENAVRLDALCRRVSMDERKVRLILGKLVTEYGVPVCAHSGKAGRWLARSFDEARETQAEYYSRAREDKRRGDAFNTCNYPPVQAEELRELQPTLIDVPEPDPIPFWRW